MPTRPNGWHPTFAENLRLELRLQDISQQRLADALGVRQPTVNRWVSRSGHRREPSLETLRRICKYLDVTPSWLLRDDT